ncbi:MAG: deoxyuridine 5'-triphosphate nucleotidohydrolase [Chloroflexi bacterium]|nr:deoxyuridine 5'-triphosphate nucleotidohydrolase [Chloroflexota bacterium]
MPVLSREAILKRLEASPPLVEGLLDREAQLQPNGVDLTLASLARLATPGQLGVRDAERVLSQRLPVEFDGAGWAQLAPGPYMCIFNEAVHLPRDTMAFGRTRSSLLRCGVSLHTAVWDAGYSGRSESLLVVYNLEGVRLARNARVMQLVFLQLDRETDRGYAGRFLKENL